MLMLETAKYLGTNKTCVQAGGVSVSLTHYQEEKEPGFPMHAHINPHLTLLLAGGTAEKWEGGICERMAGDIVYYPAGEPHHNLQTLGGSKNINVEFEPSFFTRHEIDESVVALAVNKNTTTKFLLLKVYRELICADIFSPASVDMLILELLNGSDRNNNNKRIPEWMKKVQQYLSDNWDKTVTLQELSRAAEVHPTTISKYFPLYFSCTLGEYLRRIKIEKSLALIKSSRLSLLEIALECGFADQSHFIRVFKMTTGFLPNDFRKL
jgi:AraC family transcriptional regulator